MSGSASTAAREAEPWGCFQVEDARRRRGRQAGQALTEFLVAATFVLLPLLIGITYLSRLQDVGHAAEMATRYVAFDASSKSDQPARWRDLETLQSEVRLRFFTDPNAPISSLSAFADAPAMPFWTLEDGSAMAGENAAGVILASGQANLGTSIADGFSASSDAAAFNLPVRNALSLGANGIYTANVNVDPAYVGKGGEAFRLYGALGGVDLRIRRSVSSLNSDWAAASRDDVVNRITADTTVLPSTALWPELTDSARSVPGVEFPGPIPGPRLTAWRDLVPADRRP